jgi:HK97 family phage portal protein
MANALTRLIEKALGHAEGEAHNGPWWLPITGAWLPHDVGKYWNWWQLGFDPSPMAPSAMVEACISAYARTVAMAPGDHWRVRENGGRERIRTSAASRIVRRPNDYESISDFLYNTVRQLFLTGNAYAYAVRNDRFEVAELHLMLAAASGVRIASSGDVFYHLGGNEIIEARLGQNRSQELAQVPARDVLHIRLNTPRNRLIGESPLLAALPDMAAAGAMTTQQIAFYQNQARPSMVLSTDEKLTREQIGQLRENWNAQAVGLNAGGTPILAWGLKPHTLGGNADEAQFVQAQEATDRHIALALGVPLQVLGVGKGAPFASTEAMMQAWLAGGLGFILNHVELAFDRLFGMRPDEYIEFDTSALLRSNQREQMETMKTAISAGLLKVNEGRADIQREPVEGGDQVYIQQQNVPLGWHQDQAKAKEQSPASPPPPREPSPDDSRKWQRAIIAAADAYDRRVA